MQARGESAARVRGGMWVVTIGMLVAVLPGAPRRAGARCAPQVCGYPMAIAGIPDGGTAHLQGEMLSNGGDDRRLIVEGWETPAGSCVGGARWWRGELQWRPEDASVDADGALRIRYDDPSRVEDRSWVHNGFGSQLVPAMDVRVQRDGSISGTATFVPDHRVATDVDAGPPVTFAGTFSGRTGIDCFETTGVLDIPLADGTTLDLPCVATPLPPAPPCDDTGGGC